MSCASSSNAFWSSSSNPFFTAQSISMIATTYFRQKKKSSHGNSRTTPFTHLASLHNRNNNLTHRISITSDMTRKLLNIRHQLRPALLGRSSTDTPTKRNRLASNLALERPKNKLRPLRRIQDIKASPIHRIRRRRQRMKRMPEKRSRIREIAKSSISLGLAPHQRCRASLPNLARTPLISST